MHMPDAGEAYEQAVQLALHTQSEAAIEAAFAQLNTFYDDTRCAARRLGHPISPFQHNSSSSKDS